MCESKSSRRFSKNPQSCTHTHYSYSLAAHFIPRPSRLPIHSRWFCSYPWSPHLLAGLS